MTSRRPRSITELLEVVSAPNGLPFTGRGVVEAYRADEITKREAEMLSQHAKRSPRSQAGVLRGEKVDSVADVERMSAKLRALRRRLNG